MKTSRRKYNQHYRHQHLGIDDFNNPTIVPYCNEHTRCDECRSHVRLVGFHGYPEGWLRVYECPTCGKSYGVLHKDRDMEGEE